MNVESFLYHLQVYLTDIRIIQIMNLTKLFPKVILDT